MIAPFVTRSRELIDEGGCAKVTAKSLRMQAQSLKETAEQRLRDLERNRKELTELEQSAGSCQHYKDDQ